MKLARAVRPLLTGLIVMAAHSAFAVPPGNGLTSQNSRSSYLPNRSTVSPYVSLAGGRSSGAASYYAYVRPQIIQEETNRQQAASIQQLEQQLRTQAQGAEAQQRPYTIRGTGYRSGFMTHGQYFGRHGR